MRDVSIHLIAAASATLSDSPNDEVHRRRFVQVAELVMRQAVKTGLIASFRVQCDGANNSGLDEAGCFKAHVFYRKSHAEWFTMELVLGEDDWMIIDHVSSE